MRPRPMLFAIVLAATASLAQQPNTAHASLYVAGLNGPPYPISTTLSTGTLVWSTVLGLPGSPFAIFGSATGLAQAGTAAALGGIVDLPLSPAPLVLLDGFQNPGFSLNAGGAFGLGTTIPPAMAGSSIAVQGLVADPTSPFGVRLTAATQAAIVTGPVSVTLTLGNDTTAVVNLAAQGFTIPFYGATYGQIAIDSNGYVSFGAPVPSQPLSNPIAFNLGPPRIAGLWTDLDPTLGGSVTVTYLIGGSEPPAVKLDYVGVAPAGIGSPPEFTFTILMRADGSLHIAFAPQSGAPPPSFPTLVGIGPGGGLGVGPAKNLLGILTSSPFALVGGVNETFYTWFGNPAANPLYTNPFPVPYNLSGATLHFQPVGAGPLPGNTNRYALY